MTSALSTIWTSTPVSTSAPTSDMHLPPGVVPDPSAPNPLRTTVIAVISLCTALTSILQLVRVFVRWHIMKRWGLEDALCFVSWALFIVFTAFVMVSTNAGGGQHQYNLSKKQASEALYYLESVDQIIYSVAILSIKVTLLYLYKCIFAPARGTRRWWAIVSVMVLNICFYTGLIFAKIFLCSPRAALWDKSIPGHCGSQLADLIASGVWNVGSDLVILALPAVFVWKLKLSSKKKTALVATFAMGAIAPAFAVLGLAMRDRYTTIPGDATWGIEHVLLFAYAEVSAGQVCTCITVLPRLYRWIRGREQAAFLARSSGLPRSYGSTTGPPAPHATADSRSMGIGRRYTKRANVQGIQDLDILATQTYVELVENETGSTQADTTSTKARDPL